VIPAVAPAGDGFPTGQPPGRVPHVGQLVQVRSRHWLVEEITPPSQPGGSARVSLACADDDNQGQSLTVLWDYELDRQTLFEKSCFDRVSGWSNCEPCADGHTDPSLWTCRAFREAPVAQVPYPFGAACTSLVQARSC